jgi:hypothetical protein
MLLVGIMPMPGYIVFAGTREQHHVLTGNWLLTGNSPSPQSICWENSIHSTCPHACAGRGTRMPDVTQAEIGRRMYHVHREKLVEQAIKLIQQGLGTEWKSFSEEDNLLLGHLLQCTWNTIDQKIWDKISFANIKKSDVKKILIFGKDVGPGKNPDQAAVAEIKKILLAIS